MHAIKTPPTLRRQCAWCRTVVDQAGRYSLSSREIVTGATYGICPDCKATLLAAADAEFGLEPNAEAA